MVPPFINQVHNSKVQFDRYILMKVLAFGTTRGEARMFDLVCPYFFRKLWLYAIFVRGWGIAYFIGDFIISSRKYVDVVLSMKCM